MGGGQGVEVSVMICEPVIQKQGEVHLAALHTDRWCLTADLPASDGV